MHEWKHCFSLGLERETLRVDGLGRLAQTPHPFPNHPNLDRDFCENQLELITPVCENMDLLWNSLARLDRQAREELARRGEYLWLSSNPPQIAGEEEIPIASFTGMQTGKQLYRESLAKRYGKRFMLYSGIHFNLSFHENFCYREKNPDSFYFTLHKQLCYHSWLLVLLTAASPLFDSSLVVEGRNRSYFDGYASRRNGDKGYWNHFIPILDYTSLGSYVTSIYDLVEKKGVLLAPSELYLPIRMKPRGENRVERLLVTGIDHIELRMFDLNPLVPLGIAREDLEFTCIFVYYLAQLPDFSFTEDLQIRAITMHKNAAKFHCEYEELALEILDSMRIFFHGDSEAEYLIAWQRNKIISRTRWCEQVYEMFYPDYHGLLLERTRAVGVCANSLV